MLTKIAMGAFVLLWLGSVALTIIVVVLVIMALLRYVG